MRSARISSGVVIATLATLFLLVSSASADFGVKPGGFESTLKNSAGTVEPQSQAGAHPFDQQVNITFNTIHHHYPASPGFGFEESGPEEDPDGQVKDVIVELPPGLVGNPTGVPRCANRDFPPPGFFGNARCATNTQVGIVTLQLGATSGFPPSAQSAPVYNLEPPKGVLARLGFVELAPIIIDIKVRSDGGDYGLTATLRDISQAPNVYSTSLTLWGVPAATGHDDLRYAPEAFSPGRENSEGMREGLPSTAPKKPFLSNPTRCGVPLPSALNVTSWQAPETLIPAAPTSAMSFVGCSQVDFNPSIEVHPTTTLADAPTGLEFGLHIPQNEDPEGLTTAHMRNAVVKLPPGMTINPPSADVLQSCSLEQVGISSTGVPNGSPVSCPNESILGKATLITPSLDHPVSGTVYLAQQNANPFNSLLAMYLVLEDPQSGLLIKLAGRIEPDPNTGQLTVSFVENPQLPVEDLKLNFFGGPHAALKTPEECGPHAASATLTPWTSPEGATAQRSSSFTLTNGPSGGACLPTGASAPNQFSFVGGTVDSTSKAFSPFTFKLVRADGTQQLKAIDTVLPKGLLGKLAGIPYCPDAGLAAAAGHSGRAEQSSPSCPSASRIGGVNVAAGAGATPLNVPGNVYLAGPYKGAPLSLAVITPAVAGPFDLGTVVIRTALKVNPETTQIDAVSDPLPSILQGIPLDLRSVTLNIDRPNFTLNPTNCSPMSVFGSATTLFDQSAPLSSPFQVDECGGLGFKPKLTLRLKGGTKRADHPALTAVLTTRPGDANIAGTSVAMPHSEFLAQNHIRTVCTRVQFAAGAGNGAECPAGSIYGSATATSPLLDKALSGPVYLRSSSNKLPDLVAALNGQIDIALVGRIDSVKGGIRASFESVPDAPVTKFVLSMKGGKKGLLENSRDLCKSTNKATVEMDAQNGKAADSTPALISSGCKKAGKHAKGHKRHGH
jgi:hypothetical protein